MKKQATMYVKDAKPGQTIELHPIPGNRYTVLSYQDHPGKVRAEATAGRHIVYLHPGNVCEVVR